ncbi:pyridoxamine 5'-phosphate oxidase [Marinimicrobium sp. ABcell2]|uniref:pyridoxamine 5'-phosphate oxidase n=1 Tax=Marinimicrobium sp. ABcell2 TaxID=3069751 RepID=UPI0027B7529A|nr:pyridoxamine 5'-phosphate oxidase [Marinimicrobium sp. ABcell2]MDQ2075358.1 pyridoxamine 5'-phosphate oxidase [Marinimicrobium sp. ABcell2]
MNYDLKDLRREYLRGGLQLTDLSADPIAQFELWMAQALEAQIPDPTAMVLATVAQDGQPSQRIVLLKGLDKRGFVFYTNLRSRKGLELHSNPKVSLHFPWHVLERQVSVCGVVQPLDRDEVADYFRRRPRESQIAAWASRQSRAIASRAELLERYKATEERFDQEDVPPPEFWGGFRVRPHQVEFWQGGAHRLHDRYQYTLQAEGNWAIDRLEP